MHMVFLTSGAGDQRSEHQPGSLLAASLLQASNQNPSFWPTPARDWEPESTLTRQNDCFFMLPELQ